jgi:hypothetical protein
MPININGTTGISGVDGSAGTPGIQGSDTNTGIFFPAADTIAFSEGGVEVMRLDSSANLQFNSGYGSVATAYGCRAWVNFNGTGTVAIRASGNVSSITDNNVGDYTVNFTTAMPDANYSVTGATANNDSSSAVAAQINLGTIATITNTSLRFFIGRQYSPYSYQDIQQINIAVFR